MFAVYDDVLAITVGPGHDGLRQASQVPDLFDELGKSLVGHAVRIVVVGLQCRDRQGDCRHHLHLPQPKRVDQYVCVGAVEKLNFR